MMKFYTIILINLFSFVAYNQIDTIIESTIEPQVEHRIYIDENIEFQCLLKNNSNDVYYTPTRSLTAYPESFVAQNFQLFGPDGKEIIVKTAPRGNGNSQEYSTNPASIIASTGKGSKVNSFHRSFTEPGRYKLILTYRIDSQSQPTYLTTTYKSFETKTELEFQVFDRSSIPLEIKDIDYETFKKQPIIRDLTKLNDSTNVFRLVTNDINEKGLEDIAKFKNIKGLLIYSTNISQIPDAIYDLDLYELTLDFHALKITSDLDLMKLSRFKNLRTLNIFVAGNAIIPEDFSQFEKLTDLKLSGFKNVVFIRSLPKSSVTSLEFENLESLENINGNFSDFPQLKELVFVNIKEWQIPEKISGKIEKLVFCPRAFTQFPDLSELKLRSINFNTFTGESLPENFETGLSPGASVRFPEDLYKSKDYKELSKKGFRVLPK